MMRMILAGLCSESGSRFAGLIFFERNVTATCLSKLKVMHGGGGSKGNNRVTT